MLVEQDQGRVNGGSYEVEVAFTHIHRLIPVLDVFPAFRRLTGDVIAIPSLGVCPLRIVMESLFLLQVVAVAAQTGI